MHRATRIHLSELNSHLMCALCGGYFVDATTIIECLHSFCKTCIVRYLETSKFCPLCDVQVHKTRPLLNIRPDQTLQDLVYKLVPGLFINEMKKRREFYAKNPMPGTSKSASCHQMSLPMSSLDKCAIFMQDEKISLCLEFSPDGKPLKDINEKHRKNKQPEQILRKRYLLCPAAFTVGYLKKFIRLKYDLAHYHQIDIFHTDEPLNDLYTLADIAFICTWRRTLPLRLFYSIYENPPKTIKHAKTAEMTTVGIPITTSADVPMTSTFSTHFTPSVSTPVTPFDATHMTPPTVTHVTTQSAVPSVIAATSDVATAVCTPVAKVDTKSTTLTPAVTSTGMTVSRDLNTHINANSPVAHVVTTRETVTDNAPTVAASLPPLIQPPSTSSSASTTSYLIDDATSADDDLSSGPSEALKRAMASLGLIHSVPVRLPISNQSRRLLAKRKSDPYGERSLDVDQSGEDARRKSDGPVGMKRQWQNDNDDDNDDIKRRRDVVKTCANEGGLMKENALDEGRNDMTHADTENGAQRTEVRQSEPNVHQNEADQSCNLAEQNGNGAAEGREALSSSKPEVCHGSDIRGDTQNGNGITEMHTETIDAGNVSNGITADRRLQVSPACHVTEQHGGVPATDLQLTGQTREQLNTKKTEDEQEVPLDLHRPKCVSVK